MNQPPGITDLRPNTDQGVGVDTAWDQRRTVLTLRDMDNTLEDAARSGMPSIADWPNRQVDFRMLARVLGGLDHPVETFGALLPADWSKVPPDIRDRIPGNSVANHLRLSARMRRAIGLLRPDLDPWSALQLFADVETPTNAGIVGEVQRRAAEDGLMPIDIDNDWIVRRLAAVGPEDEARHRPIYRFLVRLSERPRVQRTGLLRTDLIVPATTRQDQRAAVLPDWLQDIADVSDRQTRNGFGRLWRTLMHHGLAAHSPDDILALIDAGKLRHDAAQRVEPITPESWRCYIQSVRRALLTRVGNPALYAKRITHTEAPRKPRSLQPKQSEKDRAGFRLAMDAVATLEPPVDTNGDTLLTQDVWPRVATAMHLLGRQRGLAAATVGGYIEEAKHVLSKQATRPVPARLPRTVRTPKTIPPKPPRRPSKAPALPAALCAELHDLLDLRGYAHNAKRAMVTALGKAYVHGVKAGKFDDAPSLGEVVTCGMSHMSGRVQTHANRMAEIVRLCAHPDYRGVLAALRRARIPISDDPTARLFAATQGDVPLSAITRDWAWAHERDLEPAPRKTFSKATDQLDALRTIEALSPFLPQEPVGPLQASVLRRGKRHQHARYPLPRRIEAEAAALGLDQDGAEYFEMMAGLHAIHDAARIAGLVQAGHDIGCADLLCSATMDALARADVISKNALGTARKRTAALWPDEPDTTPALRWRTLLAQIKAAGKHNPRPDGSGVRIPGYYAVRREALEDNLGPEMLTLAWARGALTRLSDDRAARSSFRQGLRLLLEWSATPGIDADLLPPEPFDPDLLALRKP